MNTPVRKTLAAAFTFAIAATFAAPAMAQDTMQSMDMSSMRGRQPPAKKPAPKKPKQATKKPHAASVPASASTISPGMESMHGMDMSTPPSGDAPANGRSPDYSDGHGYSSMPGMAMHDNPALGMVLLDQLEYVHSRNGGNAAVIDGEAWYGGNLDKLWLKFEGDRAAGKLQDLRTEALWDHAVTTYWDTQVGARHDFGIGPGRSWAAFGIQGLAPYWFETEATFYVGQGGRTAARVQVEYAALLTQRLILQPRVEVNLYGRADPRRGIGSGLSDLEAGLRLRYEIRREFAPYIGVVWRQRFGRTADLARALGEHADDLGFVAGFRLWF